MTGYKQRGPGRPRGEISQLIMSLISEAGPITARQVAYQLKIPVNVAEFTCNRLAARGDIEVVDRIRQLGVNRRVGRYVVVSKPISSGHIDLAQLWSHQ